MFFATAALLALTVVAKAQDVTFGVASISQCASSVIDLSGAQGPYYVAILPAENPCDHDPIQEFFDVSVTSTLEDVSLPQGAEVVIYVEDVNNAEYWSSTLTIGETDLACLTSAPTTSSTATAARFTPPSTTTVRTPENAAPEVLTPESDEDSSDIANAQNSPNGEEGGAASTGVSITVLASVMLASVFSML